MASQISYRKTIVMAIVICQLVALLYMSYYRPTCSATSELMYTTSVDQQASSSLLGYSLSKTADENNNVILGFVDSGFMDFAVNLYIASFEPLGLKNHLFLASDDTVCPAFRKIAPGVNCVQTSVDEASDEASSFGSKGFVRKNWRKIKTVYDILQMGYNVLLVDIDIILFKNPFIYFAQCPDCDLQIQHDGGMICAGFYYARSTEHSIELMRRVWKHWHDYITGVTKHKVQDNDQVVMNLTIADMKRTTKGFHHKVLPVDEFGNGNSYFQNQKLMFGTDGPSPPDMYMVHDNWIVSEAAKRYRFREHFMWRYDKDRYYSDPTRKYLQYENRLDVQQVGGAAEVHRLEKEALEAAFKIGFLLNRSVILPSFTCAGCEGAGMCFPPKSGRCALNAQFKVPPLERNFGNLYREHTFLDNDMVPDNVKKSVSKDIVITTDIFKKHEAFYKLSANSGEVYKPDNPSSGATDKEIQEWFSKYKDVSVLNFHSLYKAVAKLPNVAKYKDLNSRLQRGIYLHIGKYMQLGSG